MDDDNWIHGPWDKPFEAIATMKRKGIFIGFKMYPPLGYKPLDPRLPYLEKFYARCEDDGIPILAHCSPGGMTTHEAKFYHDLDKADITKRPTRIVSCSYDPCTPLGYFFDEYVHPKNWRPVLMKFPNLKLCLAHLGGREWNEDERGPGIASDWVEEIINLCNPEIVQGKNLQGKEVCFENVYTDLSCYDLCKVSVKKNITELFKEIKKKQHYQHLRDKILFGVDWYLSLITNAPEYRKYVEGFFDCMSEFDQWQWYRSALVNPATFYGLDSHQKIDKMQFALEECCKKEDDKIKDLLMENYKRITKLSKQVETIRNELRNKETK
jgi:predicted TIM-barrel fold metal-dependent hydrolase